MQEVRVITNTICHISLLRRVSNSLLSTSGGSCSGWITLMAGLPFSSYGYWPKE